MHITAILLACIASHAVRPPEACTSFVLTDSSHRYQAFLVRVLESVFFSPKPACVTRYSPGEPPPRTDAWIAWSWEGRAHLDLLHELKNDTRRGLLISPETWDASHACHGGRCDVAVLTVLDAALHPPRTVSGC